ncbi:cytochrome D1 domain-containing protein [Aquitalea sp. LB_tupeE]|uniref:cytochrome D1 domain-containing protein n=1 Tax=Aquitalea sp. LB_tupeE TaxID=2748078 RepID=UPI0015B97851|nr:cytochrome D1 domain-containing protein [Aquitalea sp. LB_tupeE]NWK78807.1 protein nirF [Aquitalea sp. LB_tupeE]
MAKAPLSVIVLCILSVITGCASPNIRGTGDLGVIIERSSGSVQIVDGTDCVSLGRVTGLGDLSHASLVFSKDQRFVFVFGRDGGITKIDLLLGKVVKRVIQATNSIGGAISADGKLIAVQNYEPGGVKIFDSKSLNLISQIVAPIGATGKPSRVVGLADLPDNKFAYSLFDSNEIDIVDVKKPSDPSVTRFKNIGKSPYDALASPDGRYYIAGLYGEDGLAIVDNWNPESGARRILSGYGRGEKNLPVYKMPHLRGWSLSGELAFFPSIGHHEVIMADAHNWNQITSIKVAGQPVFVMADPSGRRVWVNFAYPDNDKVQVIDVPTRSIIATLSPGKAILHMEFTSKGDAVWLSSRDDNKVVVIDTSSLKVINELSAESPSGIFFSWRSSRIGM